MMKPLGLVAALLVTGCAGNQDTRTLAGSSGLYVGSLSEGTKAFVEDQNALNAASAAHLDRLAAYGRPERAALYRQRVAWTVGRERDKVAAFEAATSVQPEMILAALNPASTDAAKIANGTAANYETAIHRLAELSKKPKPLNLFKGALAYLDKVKKSHDTLSDDARAAAKATLGRTDAADAQASVAATPAGK